MKKILARIFVVMLILANGIPVISFAEDGKTSPPREPYEKVVGERGNWYAEQINLGDGSKLVTGYLGTYESNGNVPIMEFKVSEKTLLKGIYLPFANQVAEPVIIQLTDKKGNVYQNLITKAIPGTKTNYVFIPENEIILPSGKYTMTLSSYDGAVGTFLVKGVNYAGYEKYRDDLLKWEGQNNPFISEEDAVIQTLGNEEFSKENLDKFQYEEFENPPEKKPAVFSLDAEYLIDEIIINTYNDGSGALPGTISILGENGRTLVSQQAYGSSLGDVANGVWAIAPNIVLAPGNYYIATSDPNVISYDKFGDPLFYVKASIPVAIRYDFTGTYRIDLDAYKTSTLMGPVSESISSFSLKEFELTVLDKEGEIELIGKYKGMPFSQNCEIIEETENNIIAQFDFEADLSKLPYKARIGAAAVVNLTKPENGEAQISITGTGTFERDATAEKGADFNTYSILSSGVMLQRELPAFVLTALGKSGSVGNIPGSDTPMQTTAGILFPPLVGLVVATLQDVLKPKEVKQKTKIKTKEKATVRDRNWYKRKYPDLDDNQLAMLMLADAMGSTDNPDEGDAISIGDNEKPGGSDYHAPEGEETSYEDEYEETPEPTDESEYEVEKEYEKDTDKSEKTIPNQENEKPEIPEEPEEMVLKTSANGAESRYVKDPDTGQWINAETGGALDYEKYQSSMTKQLEADKKINDGEFSKNTNSEMEHDKNLKEEMKKIRDEEDKLAYQNKMKSKYGIDDVEDINTHLEEKAIKEKKSFEKWQTIGDINAVGEVGATVVGTAADVAIDGLSEVTPGGDYIKAGYKVSKGIAGTMAEKGMNEGAFVEGAIKGGADAATDFVKLDNPYAKAAAKGALNVAGEAGGSAAGAAIRGGDEDWLKAGTEGAVDGIFKAGVGAATDGIVGDAPKAVLPKGPTKILGTMKNVLVNKASGQKIASSLTDEFAVKPKATQPVKDALKGVFDKNKK